MTLAVKHMCWKCHKVDSEEFFGEVRLSFSSTSKAFYGFTTIYILKHIFLCADDYQSILRFAREKKLLFFRCAHIKVSVNIDGAI